jgi:microsomal prostaglandin-E synthase 2
VCPFCCKVKTVLDYYKIPYRVIEVSPLTKRQLKAGAPGHTKVPVAIIDGDILADSSAIISRIAASVRAAGKDTKAASASRGGWLRGARGPSAADADKDAAWRRWVDGRLVKVVTINIYRTGKEAWQTFDYITEAGDFGGVLEKTASRIVGAGMMYAIGGRLAKKYGIAQPPRDALAAVVGEWVDGALDGGAFAGGAAPSLADLSAFGVWRAVRGTDTFADAMAGSPALRAWFERMEGAVGGSARV